MKSLRKIKEQMWKIDSNPSLFKQLFSDWIDVDKYACPYAFAIYIDDTPKVCINGAVRFEQQSNDPLEFNFTSFLEYNNPTCFKDLLFLLGIYNLGRDSKILLKKNALNGKNIKNPVFKDVPVVDALLNESNGFLLWHYQMENLYKIFDENVTNAIEFRKDINKKKYDAFKEARRLKFTNGINLEEVIWDRMVVSCVLSPNIYGANILFNHLFG